MPAVLTLNFMDGEDASIHIRVAIECYHLVSRPGRISMYVSLI